MDRLRKFLPIIFLALISVIPLWRAVFLGEAIGPFDHIGQMAPWNGPKPSTPWDVLQADGVLQFFGWRDMVFDAWGKGQLPLWNPYELGGTPLLANSQSAGFYPLHILVGVAHVPTAIAMTVLAWFHLAWAGIGCYLLGRKLGATRLGATFGATSFSLSAFMLAWTGLPSVITTVAWIPWCLAFVVTLFSNRTGMSALCLAGSVGMMILAGHLQFVAYGVIAIILVAAACAVFPPSWIFGADASEAASATEGWSKLRSSLMLGLALVTGGLLAAPQLLPVLDYSQYSHRKNTPTEEGYKAYTSSAIQAFELANLGSVSNLGSPREGIDVGGGKLMAAYWPGFAKQGANYAESAVTLGPMLLALLVLGFYVSKQARVLGGIGLVALLLAMGTPLNWPLYHLVPGWSSTGSPGRIIVLFVMMACVISGLLFSSTSQAKIKGKGLIGLVLGAIVLPLLFNALGQGTTLNAPEELQKVLKGSAAASLLSVQLPLIAFSVLGLVLLFEPKLSKYRPAVILFPVILGWFGYASNMVMTGQLKTNHALSKNEKAPLGRIATINDGWSLQVAANAVLPPNLASQSRIAEIGGYDSLLHRDTVAMLADIDGKDPAPLANGNMMFIKPTADPEKLRMVGVTEVWSRTDLPSGFGTPEPRDGYVVYHLNGPGRLSSAKDPGKVEDGYDRKKVIFPSGISSGILRDRVMPGWHMGNPSGHYEELPPTDGRTLKGMASAVACANSSSQCELVYEAPGLKNGFIGFGASLVCLVLIGVLSLTRSSQRPVK